MARRDIARALHQQKQILCRARLGSVTLDNLSMANGLDRQFEWLLYRKDARGEDVHASAMVRKRNQAWRRGNWPMGTQGCAGTGGLNTEPLRLQGPYPALPRLYGT